MYTVVYTWWFTYTMVYMYVVVHVCCGVHVVVKDLCKSQFSSYARA